MKRVTGKKIAFAAVLALLLVLAFALPFSYAYWDNYLPAKDEGSLQVIIRIPPEDEPDVPPEPSRPDEPDVPPEVTPGLTYGRYALVRDGVSAYYRTSAVSTVTPPTEDMTGWIRVPNYNDVIGTAQWDKNVSYPSHTPQVSGAIVEYDGVFYQRASGNAAQGIPPPDIPASQYGWNRVLSWEETVAPARFSVGEYQPFKIFYLENGGARDYYALVAPDFGPWNGAGDQPGTVNNRFWRFVPEWTEEEVFTNWVNKSNYGDMDHPRYPWGPVTEQYHCNTVKNGTPVFWELRAPQTIASRRGGAYRPGESADWVPFQFPCTADVVITGTGRTKSVWTRSAVTPTTVSPFDPGQTVWTQRIFASTTAQFVFILDEVGVLTLFEKTVGGATAVIPGTDPSVWAPRPVTQPY